MCAQIRKADGRLSDDGRRDEQLAIGALARETPLEEKEEEWWQRNGPPSSQLASFPPSVGLETSGKEDVQIEWHASCV